MKDSRQGPCCQSHHEGAPVVRNSRGVESAFSVDRFSAIQLTHGLELEEARRLARELLADIGRAGLKEVTTDDIRHWLQERDPNILTARRTQDSRLAELAEFSEQAGGYSGLLLHHLHVDHFRPGPDGLILRQEVDGKKEKEPIPPWPDEGKEDPLEKPFGPDADRIKILTPKEHEKLRRAKPDEDVSGLGSKPKDADFTKPAQDGTPLPLPDYGWKYALFRCYYSERTWRLASDTFAPCGEVWTLQITFSRNVPNCAGLNWAADYRATLLRAHAEAFRLCRKHHPTKCPSAKLWLLHRGWNCVIEGPPHNRRPLKQVWMQLAVVCVAV